MTQVVLSRVLFGLAVVGLLVPSSTLKAQASKSESVTSAIVDVKLESARLNGRLISPDGKVLPGEQIVLLKDQNVVSTAKTTEQGEFQFQSLNSGLYQLKAEQFITNVRVWDANIAPQSAKSNLLMVKGNVTRAQMDALNPLFITSTAIGIAGLTTGVIAINQANDNEDAINSLPSSP